MRKVKYWYRFHISERVICGRDKSWKEQVYGPRPYDPTRRYIHEPEWACDEHFL